MIILEDEFKIKELKPKLSIKYNTSDLKIEPIHIKIENKELKKIKREELIEIKIIGMFFCLVTLITILFVIGFCKAYCNGSNVLAFYFLVIGTPICFIFWFIWIIFKLYNNYKEKYKDVILDGK